MNILLIMMGGKGVRFGANVPKQYTIVNDFPIFSYIVKEYTQIRQINRMVLVSHMDWIDYVRSEMEQYSVSIPWDVVQGGGTRSESVLHGLKKAMEFETGNDVVLIHDATHPYVDVNGTQKVIEAVEAFGGATLGGPEYDTMYQTDERGFIQKVLLRQFTFSGASPEAFRLQTIYQIYVSAGKEELDSMTSAGAIALAHGIPMKVIPASYLNLKITHGRDMELFRQLFDYYFS